MSSFTCRNPLSIEPSIRPDFEIQRIQEPSMMDFYKNYMKAEKPVIITGAMDSWPAMNERSWSDLQYLKVG